MWVCDSFQGFEPDPWDGDHGWTKQNTVVAVDEEEVRDNMARFLPDVAAQPIDEEGHWDCSRAVTALMHDLVTCIEFHDVVKQRLGEAAKRAGVPLRPKRIYELLSALLAENAAGPAYMLNDEPYDEAVRRSDARRV